ncbi:AI-2E family transporter [Campylobacter sp.]|uniref:AI-2E family transporter n=1 Tax=Campylobacter sp. TaxID=205 RepID=UPI0026FDBF8F|nr:AI-2E family transporter [Campylobacter sp.]
MVKNSRIFFGIFVFFALCLLLYLFKPFLLNISIAILLAVATSNINVKFLKLTKHRQTLSAALTTAALFLLFIAPFIYAVIALAKHAANFNMQYVSDTIDYVKNYDFALPQPIKFLEPKFEELFSEIDLKVISAKIISNLAEIGKFSANFLVDMTMIMIFFFFSVLYGSDLVKYLKKALPMKHEDTEYILSEVANVMSVVFYSIIINTIFQGFLFAIIAMIYGYGGFLMGILFGFATLVPIVGGFLVWGPISLYEFANGNLTGAIVIAVYNIVVISIIADTLLKPLIIKFINDRLVKIPTKINEMLIFFAMIAGITTFGFWGIILGPAIVTFFLSTIKLYVLLKERSFV